MLVVVSLFMALLYDVYHRGNNPVLPDVPAPWVLAQGLEVPETGGFYPMQRHDAGILVINGARVLSQHRIDLCDQAAQPQAQHTGMKALYAGLNWPQLQQLMAQNQARGRPAHYGIANPLMDAASPLNRAAGALDIPEFRVGVYPGSASLVPVGEVPVGEVPVSEMASGTDAGSGDRSGIANHYEQPALALYRLNDTRSLVWLSDRVPVLYSPSAPGARAQSYPFERSGWLLWRHTDDAGRMVAADPASEARWQYAVKLERQPGSQAAHCKQDYGVLTVTLMEALPEQGENTAVVYRFMTPSASVTTATRPLETVSHQRLATGRYKAHGEHYQLEDQQLFNAAVDAGLIQAAADGRATLAVRDMAVSAALAGNPWPESRRELLWRLHYSAPGRYIQQQIKRWNRESRPAGVRYKRLNAEARLLMGEHDIDSVRQQPWQASQAGHPLSFGGRPPLQAGGLFEHLPQQWSDWLMLSQGSVQSNDHRVVQLTLPFARPATGREQFAVLVLGRQVKLQQGRLLKSSFRCLKLPCTGARQLARLLWVSPTVGARALSVQLQPLTPVQALQLYRADHQPVQVSQGVPRWNPPAIRRAAASATIMDVRLRDRQGEPLWQNFKTLTATVNGQLDPLYGLAAGHQRSLGGMLTRLGRHGYRQVQAELTLDAGLQQQVREQLHQRLALRQHPQRTGSVLMMDADSGEILVSASWPEVPQGVSWADLHAFDAADFRRSPLRPRTLQHDGYSYNAPGSVFKLVVALTLEKMAQTDPQLLAELKGLNMVALDRAGRRAGYQFSSRADCYPAQKGCLNARGRWPVNALKHYPIVNFRKGGIFESPRSMLQRETHYGLTEALRDSLNTWFAWQADRSDQTLLSSRGTIGMAHARALTPDGLDKQRPMMAMVRQLGLLQPVRLDGGLLPENFDWRTGDLLQASAGNIDPFNSRRNILQAAIGLRMQMTPLQIARLSATLASGRLSQPRLLNSLNGRRAQSQPSPTLNIELSRIHAGMKAVPITGTAKTAFAAPRFQQLRQRLYLKTGTAPVRSNSQARGSLNSAWLTGWLEPAKADGKRIAFACMLGYSKLTGGKDCGPLMAEILLQMETDGLEADNRAPTSKPLPPGILATESVAINGRRETRGS